MPISAPSTSLNLRGQASDAEKLKRRCLLPQLGQSRYSSRARSELPDRHTEFKGPLLSTIQPPGSSELAATTSEPDVQNVMSGRLRPRSIYQTGITPSERAGHGDKQATSRSMHPPSSVNKSSELQTVVLSRTQSLRKPGVPVKSSRSAGTSHSRAQSTSTVSVTRKDTAKPRTHTEKPKSLLAAPNFSSKTIVASTDVVPAITRTSARLAGLGRSTIIKAGREGLSGVADAGTTSRPEEPLVSQARRREPTNEEPKKIARPAFSTLQQHFTPRKIGKAPTSTFLHPVPVVGTQSLPSEIVSLQSELLQLHLLHESSAQVSRSWEFSAKRSLHAKFEEVASMYQAMLEYECADQEQNNLLALLQWSGTSSAGLVEHIQVLSGPLHELPSLVESGGRVQRLVSDFEHWMSWVEDVQSARKSPTGDRGALVSLEGLGDSWKAENAALTRKLTSFARDLDRLDEPSPGSSIACIVETCKSLLGGLLEELQTMQKIESDVVLKERTWVEDRLQVIAQGPGAYMVDSSADTPAWRM